MDCFIKNFEKILGFGILLLFIFSFYSPKGVAMEPIEPPDAFFHPVFAHRNFARNPLERSKDRENSVEKLPNFSCFLPQNKLASQCEGCFQEPWLPYQNPHLLCQKNLFPMMIPSNTFQCHRQQHLYHYRRMIDLTDDDES